MRKCSLLVRSVVVLLAGVCACSAGCTKKIWITQHPQFWTEEMSKMRIAVVPFRNRTRNRHAAEALSDELAYALSANAQAIGSYGSVLNRNDIAALLDQRDLQLALGKSDADLARQFREVADADVDAILVGTVTTYSATTRNERRREPRNIYNSDGKVIGVTYRTYVHTRNEAVVTATAALIRVRDGTILHATPSPPPTWQQWAQGSPPKMSRQACLTVARSKVVAQLVAHFAVTRRQIKITSGKDFRTARDLYDDKWTWTNKFSPSDEKAFIVLRLPPVCDRNQFRITIIRADQREDLFSGKLVWRRNWGSRGFEFSPREIAAKGGGPGKYVAKLYSGPQPVLRYAFEITPVP